MQKDRETNAPEKEIRIGTIRAAIWRNSREDTEWYNVTLNRFYRDKNDQEWKRSESFSRDDLLPLAKIVDLAHTWIVAQQNKRQTRTERD